MGSFEGGLVNAGADRTIADASRRASFSVLGAAPLIMVQA